MAASTIFLFVATSFIAVNCNLVQNGAYIDTESESAITTMCNGDVSSLSLWEQHQCEYIQNRDGYQKCWPQRRMSSCDPGQLKGAMFLYHGYSACPDQYNDFAPKLQSECWHVYLILTLGHGFNRCPHGSTQDTEGCVPSILNATDLATKYPNKDYQPWYYNESLMPDTRAPYIEYVDMMIEIIENEVSIIKECELSANSDWDAEGLEVATGGLSFGAPLAAGTVVMSGSDSVFTKYVLMSPFFGISAGPIDKAVYKCTVDSTSFVDCLPDYFKGTGFDIDDDAANTMSTMISSALSSFVDVKFMDTSYETVNLLIRKVLTWVVEDPDAISDESVRQNIKDGLSVNMPWGAQCEYDILERDRGGFCQFKVRKLVAAHSFAAYVVDLLADVDVDQSVETLLVTVERDGQTRNALVVDYVNKFYGNQPSLISSKATDCMWLIAQECQKESWQGGIDNYCGVPHSSMSRKDNMGVNPHELWWEDTYHTGLIEWLNADQNSDAAFPDNFRVKGRWDLSRNQCSYFDLVNPPKVLVAEIPTLLKIGVRAATSGIENHVLDRISELTGVSRGFIELSKNIKRRKSNNSTRRLSDAANDNEDVMEFRMYLNKKGGAILKVLAENNNITRIGNALVDYIKLNENHFNNITNVSCTVEVKKEEETSGLVWSEVMLIIVIVINVIAVIGLSVWCMKQKKNQQNEIATNYNKL